MSYIFHPIPSVQKHHSMPVSEFSCNKGGEFDCAFCILIICLGKEQLPLCLQCNVIYRHQIQLQLFMIFQGKTIRCPQGNQAYFVCTSAACNGSLFFCHKSCPCFATHAADCVFKNIRELSNGIQSLLKRNFKKDMKGESIQVVARNAKQTKPVSANAPFCFTYCEVDAAKGFDIEFKVVSLKGCIGVGALRKDTILRNLYQFIPDQDYIGHGAYMLLSNGYQYSDSKLEENFVEYRGVCLEEGATVRVVGRGKELVFEQGYKQVKMGLPEEGELIYGVYLYDEGDEVQVLVKEEEVQVLVKEEAN